MKNKNISNEPESTVNLSSVNTSKKSKNGLMPKIRINKPKVNDAYTRDHEGKFTSGSGGLKKTKTFNWKRAAPILAIVALAGGLLVFSSFAATPAMVPKTVTKTITETVPDKSKSYKTVTAKNLKGTRNTLGRTVNSTYTLAQDMWSPDGNRIKGTVKMRFGWIGTDNITVCATVLGLKNSSASIEVKNHTTVSSRGPGITTKSYEFLNNSQSEVISPTQYQNFPLPAQASSMIMVKSEFCSDNIARGNYGSDLEITVSAQYFEKLEVYSAGETTTKTITETVPDKSKSYKTSTAKDITGFGANRLHGTGSKKYVLTKNLFTGLEGLVAGPVSLRFGWVGPENITVCATVRTFQHTQVTLETRNYTSVSSQGPAIAKKTKSIKLDSESTKISPTELPGFPLSDSDKSKFMVSSQVCSDNIARSNYGSDLGMTIFAEQNLVMYFEKIDIYATEMVAANAPTQPNNQNSPASGAQEQNKQTTNETSNARNQQRKSRVQSLMEKFRSLRN